MTEQAPVISICVSTRNRAWMLEEMFAALHAQDITEPFEVSITDDGSTDDTPAMLQRLAAEAPFKVTCHRNETSLGPAAGRNLAAKHASAPFLAFTDDDCRPEPEWLSAGYRSVSRGSAVVVGQVLPIKNKQPRTPIARVVRSRHWRFFTTSATFYRASDFAAAGGFDENYTGVGGEDTDLGLRVCKAGAEPRYEPRAVVRHPVRDRDLKIAIREASRWHGIPLLVKKHPEQREIILRHRVFWRMNHQWLLLAIASIFGTAFVSRVAIIGVVPWFWRRVWRAPSRSLRVKNFVYAPVTALTDLLEIGAMVLGSIRNRTFTL
jgi:glycosyltransferase involved in cell wall biosynthesis